MEEGHSAAGPLLSGPVMLHSGVLTQEKSIKLTPGTSVLKIAYGDRIALRLSRDDFSRLAAAFFSEVEAKYL